MPGMSTGGGEVRSRPFASRRRGDRRGVERVGGDAVDRVGGDHHELAASDGAAGEAHAGEQLGVDRTVVDGSHDRSILDQRACRYPGHGRGCRRARRCGCRGPCAAASVACSRRQRRPALRRKSHAPQATEPAMMTTHQPTAHHAESPIGVPMSSDRRVSMIGRDRLVLGDPLEPVGHRLDRHERAREVRQEQEDEPVAARRLGRRRREADRREQVGDREDPERDEAEHRDPLERRRGRPESDEQRDHDRPPRWRRGCARGSRRRAR